MHFNSRRFFLVDYRLSIFCIGSKTWFIGIRPDFASTIMGAAKKEFVEQWRPTTYGEEEDVGFPAAPTPQLGKQLMSSKRKSFTAFLSGDPTGRVTPAVAPHLEKDDFGRYQELPQESE
jgi:hypothetical protein